MASGGPTSQAFTLGQQSVRLQALREPLTREQAALFDSCQGMVRSLAWRTHQKIGKFIEMDDLIAYGQLGLIAAARNYEAGHGAAFSTFAHYRIRGAILDGLQKHRWFNNAAFQGSKYQQLAQDYLGSAAADWSEEKDEQWLASSSQSLAVSFVLSSDAGAAAAAVADESEPEPGAELMTEELRVLVRRAIAELPPQVAEMIRWTYFEGMNITEAGKRLGVGKTWASRLHARALQMLAKKLKTLGYEHD